LFPGNNVFLLRIHTKYLLLTVIFIYAISLITSSLNVFLKDVGQIVSLVLQFGYWLTPIFWSLKMIPAKYEQIIKLNPMYYIVEGYRNSFIFKNWFWQYPQQTIYFWIVCLGLLSVGNFLYKKLKNHFVDVM
jgi:ABC-type polysaccharide/polyol phosphate export permease